MEIFRTEKDVDLDAVAAREGANWRRISGRFRVPTGGFVLTGVTEKEEDRLAEMQTEVDPLRGIVATLHIIGDKKEEDPTEINLLTLPMRGQALRHRDQYYLVTLVCQSSNFSAAVFAKRITLQEFWALADEARLL